MSYLSDVLSPRAREANAMDPKYWPATDEGGASLAGPYVDPETAMTVRAVYRCVSLLSGVVASLPLHIYRRMEQEGEEGKERATSHPLYGLFKLGPNRYQTAEQWLRLVVAHLELRGNSYNRIIAGPRGIVDQLIPLHPARVTPEVNNEDGRGWLNAWNATMTGNTLMRYKVIGDSGRFEVLTEEEVLHIRGLSSNGLMGLSRITLMRQAVGLSLATESYGARFFSQSAAPRGAYKLPGKISKEAYERLAHAIQAEGAGLANAHKAKILEEGAEWQAIGMSNQDSQFLETRRYQATEIAGWHGVPPHLIAETDKTTSWGSGISEQNLALLIYTIAPILESIEQSIDKELIVADRTYFAEFLPDQLLRMDPKASAETENVRFQNGTLNRNEARALSNRNPVPGGKDFMVPLNMQVVGQAAPLKDRVEATGQLVRAGFKPEAALEAMGLPPMEHLGLPPVTVQPASKPKPAVPPGTPPPDDPDAQPDEQPEVDPDAPPKDRAASHTTKRAARHVLHKEASWVATWAPRLASDPAKWRDKVTDFYERHAAMVTDWLGLSDAEAAAYCAAQRDALLAAGVKVAETWETERVNALAALAFQEGEAA